MLSARASGYAPSVRVVWALFLLTIASWPWARAEAQASAELDDPRGGQRLFVASPGEVVLSGEEVERRCEAPCLLHLPRGRYHLSHRTLGVSADLRVGRFPLVARAQGRSDLGLGLGIAAVLVSLGAAGTALGVDGSNPEGCIRGGPCEGAFIGVLVPAGVALILGIVLIFDSGGELTVQELTHLPEISHHDRDPL